MFDASTFIREHWVFGGIATSLLWFLAGKQSLSNRNREAALLWEGVAVMIVATMCGWAIAEKEWLGLVFGVAVLVFEVSAIRRVSRSEDGRKSAQT